jgi:hypothetical protein
MSVALSADAPSTARSATVRRRGGRHRIGTPAGVRCTDLPAVRERMQFSRTPAEHRRAFLRWLAPTAPSGRHTWTFLTGSGGRPRTAFAIILSL